VGWRTPDKGRITGFDPKDRESTTQSIRGRRPCHANKDPRRLGGRLALEAGLAELAGPGKRCRIRAAIVLGVASHCLFHCGIRSSLSHRTRRFNRQNASKTLEADSKTDQASQQEARKFHDVILAEGKTICQSGRPRGANCVEPPVPILSCANLQWVSLRVTHRHSRTSGLYNQRVTREVRVLSWAPVILMACFSRT
jgi:hypothetical protein